MALISDIQFLLSGGSTNTDPNAALGGAISSSAIAHQGVSRSTSTITGVTISEASGNPTGTGLLEFVSGTPDSLVWTPFGALPGAGVDVSTDGTYYLYAGDTEGHLKVTVVAASLPASYQDDEVVIASPSENLFGDVTVSQAQSGRTEYRCFYIKNNAGTGALTIKPYFAESTGSSGEDVIEIAPDPAGVNGTATTIADETTPPTGVTGWALPNVAADATSVALDAGEYQAYWLRRTIPANVQSAALPSVTTIVLDVS